MHFPHLLNTVLLFALDNFEATKSAVIKLSIFNVTQNNAELCREREMARIIDFFFGLSMNIT